MKYPCCDIPEYKEVWAQRAIFVEGPYNSTVRVIADNRPSKPFYDFPMKGIFPQDDAEFCPSFAKEGEFPCHRHVQAGGTRNIVDDLRYIYAGVVIYPEEETSDG